jgi:NitT/TauT family transport system ATP-binding protein
MLEATVDTTNGAMKLEARNISKTFVSREREIEVLRDVSVEVGTGQFVSIVGASGCGKTTLLRIIDGLIPPSGGEILVNGHPVDGPGRDRAFVFQQDALFPWRNVRDNVIFGLEVQGDHKGDSSERAQHFIQMVGLAGFEQHFPHELSGGMRQRANLARALTVDPDVLLMDEPFASLDAQTREIMQSELLKIWRMANKTVLFITHQIDEAVYLSDRVVVLTARPGRVKSVLDVDMPRPRELSVKRTPRFLDVVDEIWRLIEEEVKAALQIVDESEVAPRTILT